VLSDLPRTELERNSWLYSVVLLTITTLIGGCSGTVLSMMSSQFEANMTADPVAALPDGLHVLVCGAGGPLPDKKCSSATDKSDKRAPYVRK